MMNPMRLSGSAACIPVWPTQGRSAAITTINWPVDVHFEVRRDRAKDADVREYVETFLELYGSQRSLSHLNRALLQSKIHGRMIDERNTFVRTSIRNPEQYDGPPDSVEFLTLPEFEERHREVDGVLRDANEVVLYSVGMNHIRSDPYTGMSMLYRYLYIAEQPARALVLWFPNITESMWHEAAARKNRKDVRLFRIAADAILFKDRLLPRARL